VAAAGVVVAGFARAAGDEDDDGVRLGGLRFGFGHNDVGRLEALAFKLELGDGAKDALFESRDGGIVRGYGRFVAQALKSGAQDSKEPRGGICHDQYGDAANDEEAMKWRQVLFAGGEGILVKLQATDRLELAWRR